MLTSPSGLTIEVQDTDAEGRLGLADAIDTYHLSYVIDVATLTGMITGLLYEDFRRSVCKTTRLWPRISFPRASKAGSACRGCRSPKVRTMSLNPVSLMFRMWAPPDCWAPACFRRWPEPSCWRSSPARPPGLTSTSRA